MASAGVVVRARVEPGVFAALKNARTLTLECRPPSGDAAKPLLQQYLADPDRWQAYAGRLSVAIGFDQLNPEAQRTVLLTLFQSDVVTEDGWWHTVEFMGEEGMETVWTLCEWLTGKGTDYKRVVADPRNASLGTALQRGQRVFVPNGLLRPVMKRPTPERFALLEPEPVTAPPAVVSPPRDKPAWVEPEVDLEAVSRDLYYGSDAQGPYALYRLKRGEALYTAVVVRFTDYRDNAAILKACRVIQRRSGIKDVRHMKPGQKVLIPLDMVSDRYHPKGSERRRQYEAMLREADRLKRDRVTTRDLDGVVVVLDPGHGGRDHGAPNEPLELYEDELNYDVACRIRRILLTRTRAKVYMTIRDASQGYEPVDATAFRHDTDEQLLTTPPYRNTDAAISANLRWYLANSIYRREVKNGTDPRKMIFTSLHTDALFNDKLRGAMVYIPGAKHRGNGEKHSGKHYDRYKEVREQPRVTLTASERQRDEALARNFAGTLLASLGDHEPPIMRHRASDPIRSQIRQNGGRVYVPAVLRNTQIPTKVLVETANMTNPTDCDRLSDPKWREWFAEAYVDALRGYFGS